LELEQKMNQDKKDDLEFLGDTRGQTLAEDVSPVRVPDYDLAIDATYKDSYDEPKSIPNT